MNYRYLDKIQTPADLRKLPVEALPDVCRELRDFIVHALADNPGHLGSSLCMVDATVALHYVLSTPDDKIVWDVGHQAYAHKILTGRRSRFDTNRRLGGLRPFPSPLESEYDTFAAGHASNSISAALGMSVAAARDGREDERIVAVIGDGAMSGGLAFEGLNNASETPNNLLILLNDNDMSIDAPCGGLSFYLSRMLTSPFYNKVRAKAAQTLSAWGWLGQKGKRQILRFNNSLKSLLTRQQNIFEGLNIRYFGPTDGHDVVALVRTLREILPMTGPKLLHIVTQKGHGYAPAEADPTTWHAPGRFNPEDGHRAAEDRPKTEVAHRFQDVFGETLLELARADRRIVGVTPAMATGCGMSILAAEMPDRVYDVGIAEGHAVTFSGGMAKAGLHPVCNIYSAFSQRAYDNFIHDVALLSLPVTLCLDRAGLVGEDGATHHGAFDLAAFRPVPGIVIASPYDEPQLRQLLYTAVHTECPFILRYPRGGGRIAQWRVPFEPIEIGTARLLTPGEDVAVLSLGPIGTEAADAIARLKEKNPRLRPAHYDMRFLKPLDTSVLDHVARNFRCILTLEDGSRNGGFGSAVAEHLVEMPLERKPRLVRLGLPDRFVEHGTVAELRSQCGLDAESIARRLEEICADGSCPGPTPEQVPSLA